MPAALQASKLGSGLPKNHSAGCDAAGMARKRAERERQALEEAIDAGLLQRKGLGKKRRRAAAAARSRGGAAGLREDNGSFRGGVLRVRSDGKGRGDRRGAGGRSGRVG